MTDLPGESEGPLAGVRVLDLATERAELAGRLLADLGADVVKVEPTAGAAARFLPPFTKGREGDPNGSLYWAAVALGKRSVVVDLQTEAGHAELRRLAVSADVLIESFDPGTMGNMKLGFPALKKLNPRLIYVSVTPYGQDGPHALRPATDLTIEAAGGLLGLQGDSDRPPVPVGHPQAAFHAGIQAAADTIIALNERQRSGRGQHLDVSMQAAMVWTLMNATGYPPNTGGDPPKTGEARAEPPTELVPGVALPNLWPCSDGYVQMSVTIAGLGGRTLANLVHLIEAEGRLAPELAESGWASWVETMTPGQVAPELLITARDEIARYFLSLTKEQIMRRAVEHKLLIAPIRSIDELLRDPQLQARQYWESVGGRCHPGVAARLSRTPMKLRAPAPALGADQDLLTAVRLSPLRSSRRRKPGSRAFDGLKVADFAWVGVGPLISKALADHGATVVHVESATRPDVLRLGPPFKDGEPGIDRSQFQANFNSSKLGLALNLALPGGQQLARRLIAWSDVVLESFTPGVLAQFGFGYEEIARDRPDLVMLSTCICGQTGPYATYRGFGTQGAALSGLHGLTGWPDRPSRGTWGAYTDFIAPRYGVAALTAALFERSRTGLGQHIDLGQVEAAIHFAEPLVLDYTVNGRTHEAAGHSSDRACPHGVYGAEGKERYVAIAAESLEQWRALCAEAPGVRFKGWERANLAERLLHDAEIDTALADWCRDQGAFELVERLAAASVPAAVVQRPSDLHRDPQLAHRGFFVPCQHGVMGLTPYDGPVTLFSDTPAKLTAGPCLGEHTHEVLHDLLGLADEEISEYAAAGVLT
jgi:crotonobetainyl-CoA:carnitine CoA-transferase CaiB-like acyl-CoA transferase